MIEQFITVTQSLNTPLLTAADIAALRELHAQWEHWHDREEEHSEAKVAEQQKQAFDAFVEQPTAEREHRMLLTADEALTGRRWAVMRRACVALRSRIEADAAKLLHPVIDRLNAALTSEHERRLEAAEPVRSNKRNNPTVIESERALEFCNRMSNYVLWASGPADSGRSPLELAGALIALSEAQHLTAEEGR